MEQQTQEKISQEAPVANPQGTQQTPEPDLITKVSQFKIPEPSANKEGHAVEPVVELGFDAKKEIEAVKDPVQREVLQKAYKNLVAGFNNKYQEVAKQRKEFEALRAQAEAVSKQPTTWTVERLQAELNKPDFVQAAQVLMQAPQQTAEEEYSNLSPEEKAKINAMEQELLNMKKQSMLVQKQSLDNQLKQRYANYNPEAVDTLTADLLAGKVQATREHLWKVQDYDDAVRRAYELGKNDGLKDRQERINGTSFTPTSPVSVSPNTKVEQVQGETSQNFFKRIALQRLQERQSGKL